MTAAHSSALDSPGSSPVEVPSWYYQIVCLACSEGALVRDPIEAYFTQLRDVYASGAGVAETSYYGPLSTLLTDLGHKLKPKVTAIINLRNTGAGIPDGGLFTASQLKGWEPGENPLQGQLPARGAIEVKGTAADAFAIAASEQVERYVERYGLVLVTNLRDFVLVGRSADGSGVRELESCRLATTEAGFWARIQQPHKFAEDAGEGLSEFLRRVLLHNAPLSDPKDLAWFLASYARTARLRLESRHELPALDQLRNQLEESLGLKFEGEKGDHFFRSTLVQTLFYGMFASWVLWARDKDRAEVIDWRDRFQWETASQTLHVPMVAELFYQFSNPGRLRDLHIDEVLEWAEEILWRVDRVSFFEKFQEEHAVQYFYEPFLEAFDPELRKELGVWYTPDEVVKYMVARVDWALREELGIADGLADPSVVVLDPCCGTGAFLVEVLRKIDETLTAKGADALTRNDVKRAAMERVIGFEIMPAPYVVAHLQMGILLAELGVPLKDVGERAAVYLTNALTGWGDGDQVAPPKDKRVHPDQMHSTLLFPEFAEERDAADRVKREEPILVVIGNPPYNGFAGVATDEEAGLVEEFKSNLKAWGIKKHSLDDLYVRFFALAIRQVGERGSQGIVSFISNDSWLEGPSYAGVREEIVKHFGQVWVENLHGDRNKSEYGPDGKTSQTVFAIAGHSPGIRQGVCTSLWVRAVAPTTTEVNHRDDVDDSSAETRRSHLVASLDEPDWRTHYTRCRPERKNLFAFKPRVTCEDYEAWPSLTDLASLSPVNGLLEKRRNSLIDTDKEDLAARMRAYFDSGVSWEELDAMGTGLTRDAARYPARETRDRVLAAEGYCESRLRPYLFRPFDARWAYYSGVRPLWNEPRPSVAAIALSGARFLLARVRAPRDQDGAPFLFFSGLADDHALHKDAYLIPLELAPRRVNDALESGEAHYESENLSEQGLAYAEQHSAEDGGIWMHVLAVGYAPKYLKENGDGIRNGWPRIPLPKSKDLLSSSVALGTRLSQLLDPQTTGERRDTIPSLAALSAVGGATLDPAHDLAISARWGTPGRDGITMPSVGKLTERPYTDLERATIAEHAKSLSMAPEQAISLLGDTCFDIYLNDVAYWSCVPANVWPYMIGGYQVIKKWLSYREKALLGRDLKPEEARYVTEMVRRIAALVLMQPELDANYERVKSDVWEWER